VLLVIAAALGIGEAISSTGLAATVAGGMVSAAAALGVVGVLAAVYIATSIMTELITNNAAAALMLGVGLAAAEGMGAPPEAFAVAVAIAASASFVTPIGYQTNLMVMAAGGYQFADYTKSGIVVNLIVTTVALTMIWLVWL
jgi:di/tricarboxylate transporter